MSNHLDLIRILIDDSKYDNYVEEKNIIDNIVFKEIFGLISQKTPPNFPLLHFNLKENIRVFIDKLIFRQLFEKRIVSLGGSFSSGKSSFINSILNVNMLPESISPTTAVPTYLLKSDDTDIFITNNYQNKYRINYNELKNIAHGYEEDPEYIKINHLIKNVIVETQKFEFENISFLDTPGYSKSNINDFDESDEAKSMFYYNSSDYILWFVPADVGTITDDDLEILQNIKKGIPKIIVINKADKLTENDLQKVIEQIKTTLESRAISYLDIFTFSKRMPNKFDKLKIINFLKEINTKKEPNRILDGFNDFFDNILAYYNKLIVDESRRLFRLNHAVTFIDDAHAIDSILILTDEIKENIMDLKSLINKLNALRIKLFLNLREIALKYEIEFPDNFDEYITNNTKDFLTKVYSYNDTSLVNRNFEVNRKITNFIKNSGDLLFTEIFNKRVFEFNNLITEFLDIQENHENFYFSNINYSFLCKQKINSFYEELEISAKFSDIQQYNEILN